MIFFQNKAPNGKGTKINSKDIDRSVYIPSPLYKNLYDSFQILIFWPSIVDILQGLKIEIKVMKVEIYKKNILCLIVNKTMGNFLVQLLWLWIDFCWISPKVIFSQSAESFCVYSVFPENISTAKSRGKALHCYKNVTHRDERSREVDFS